MYFTHFPKIDYDVNGDGVTTKMTDITRRSRISEQSIIYAASYDYYDVGDGEKPEDIELKLRQVEVLQGQGKPLADAVRQIGVTVQTYYRWRKEYGGMSRDQLKRLKLLESENTRLRRAVSDLTLDKMILTEAAGGNY